MCVCIKKCRNAGPQLFMPNSTYSEKQCYFLGDTYNLFLISITVEERSKAILVHL